MEQVTQSDQEDAAKQLLMELTNIKNNINNSRTKITSVLVVQLKQILRGLIKKYNQAGLLEGEFVTLRLSDRTAYAQVGFVYSQGLQSLVERIKASLKEEQELTNEPS